MKRIIQILLVTALLVAVPIVCGGGKPDKGSVTTVGPRSSSRRTCALSTCALRKSMPKNTYQVL